MNNIWQLKSLTIQRNRDVYDFSNYFGKIEQTRKQLLIEECIRHDVSIYIDSPSEQSIGYPDFRGVVSEAELEKRLNKKINVEPKILGNLSAIVAIILSCIQFFTA